MLNSTASLWLGVAFVLIGAVNVWLILQASARVRDTQASTRLIAAHRVGGYLFIALFCVMGYFMLASLGDAGGGAPPGTMLHITLAMVLSPLIFVKVLVARYYKSYHSFLTPIGLTIFVLSFVLIGITAGPSLTHHVKMQTVSLAAIDLPAADIDINMAASTMEKRCSKCHNLDRIAGAHKDAPGWLATVNRMKALPDSGISEEDARIIVSYLASQMGQKGSLAAASLEVARAVVDQRCGRCHSLDRVYKTAETPEEWKATVYRMVAFAEGSGNAFQPGEDEQIIGYLSATQTPEAVNRRRVQVAAASSSGRSMVTPSAAATADRPAPPGTGGIVTTNGLFKGQNVMPLTAIEQPGGDIVVILGINNIVATEGFGLARFTSSGKLDTTFGTKGVTMVTFTDFINSPNSVAVQPDGDIVVAGNSETTSGGLAFAMARFTPNGQLDDTFGNGGLVTVNPPGIQPSASVVMVQPNGQIMEGGSVIGINSHTPGGTVLGRYKSDGSLDTTFGTNGFAVATTEVGAPSGLALLANGPTWPWGTSPE
jgi:uncharacterized delta-60 repeat protein